MELSFSFKTGKKVNTVDKARPVSALAQIGYPDNFNSYGNVSSGIFYPFNLSDTANAAALVDMYETLPEVQAPINYIIDKLSIINFDLVRNNGTKDELVEDRGIYNLINKPNQYMGKADFIKAFFLNRIVLGVGYINRIVPLGFTTPSQMYILQSTNTNPKIKKNSNVDPRLNEIEGYTTDFGYGQIQLTADEVVVQYEANLCVKVDEIKSRLLSAIMASESLRYNYEARIKIYRDRGALGVLSPKDTAVSLTKEQADQMRNQYYEDNGITGNKAPFMITPRALSYTKVGFSVDELKLNENKLQDFTTICNILNIDTALFDNTRSTYNNKMLAKKNFWEDVGIPNFNSYLEMLGKVCKLQPGLRFKADYSDIPSLQEDFKTKVDANSTAYNDGAITHAEYRESIGFEGGEASYKANQGASGQITQGQNE